MTSRNSRRTWSRGAVLATAGALAVGLLPAAAANAGSSTPVFSYVDVSAGTVADPIRQLAVADVLGAGATNLTASNYQTYAHDVSPDGATLLYAGRTGSPTASAYDSTFGVVVVHTDSSGPTPVTTSRLLATFWQGNPVLSDNGARAWFLSGGRLYKADTVSGAVTLANATAFAPGRTETVVRLAVSADGTTAAVMYAPTGTNKIARVLAAPVATGKTTTNYAEVLYPTNVAPKKTIKPDSGTFVWRGNDTLVYGQYDAATPKAITGVSVTLNGATKVTTGTPRATLNGFYDLRQDANGAWWTWKDVTTKVGTVTTTKSTAYSSADVDLFTVAPVPEASDRGNGATTYHYVPSTVNPPALVAASNRAASHLTFNFATSTARYAQRVAFQSYNLYGGGVGGLYSAGSPAEVDRGELWSSTDGVTYKKLLTTSGASAFVLGTKWFNGYTPKLARNTWFTWRFAGDAFVAKAATSVRRIVVIPNVSAKATANGASWIVSGGVTRVGGNAVLYRVVSGKLVKVASAPILARGAYTFGKRHLAHGTYRVVSPADKSWGGAYKQFSF
jgi:hypothetical protein